MFDWVELNGMTANCDSNAVVIGTGQRNGLPDLSDHVVLAVMQVPLRFIDRVLVDRLDFVYGCLVQLNDCLDEYSALPSGGCARVFIHECFGGRSALPEGRTVYVFPRELSVHPFVF